MAADKSRPETDDPAPSDIPGVITLPPLIYLVGLLAGLALERLWPLAQLPQAVRYGLGGLALGLSVALVAWSLPQFHRLRTNVSVHRPATALITSGPYRFGRNPLYIGLALLQAGLALLAGSLWAVALLVPVLAVVHHGVILREERYLERKFGEDYQDYKASVRRWL